MAEWEAGVPGAEKSGDGEGEGLVRGVRSEELREEKSMTSPRSSRRSGRRPREQSFTGVEEALWSAASRCARRMSLASCVRERFSFSCMALSTGLRPARLRSPSTVMIGSRAAFEGPDMHTHTHTHTHTIPCQNIKQAELRWCRCAGSCSVMLLHTEGGALPKAAFSQLT